MNKFEKRKLVLRQQLIGAGFFEALAAMEFAERYHTGTRKDGVTPEFDHQVSIALYVMTLPDLIYREEAIATIFLHDVKEDFGVANGEMLAIFRDKEFGLRVVEAVDCMTKKWRDEVRDEDDLFVRMANNAIASIAKGADRMHNLQSMIGVFTADKQRSYIAFAKERILPMLKAARRNFPHQVRAYENIKFVLNSQIELIEAGLDAMATK
jgi:(p)ppGpp synthase/HD superfamily hydrolase